MSPKKEPAPLTRSAGTENSIPNDGTLPKPLDVFNVENAIDAAECAALTRDLEHESAEVRSTLLCSERIAAKEAK